MNTGHFRPMLCIRRGFQSLCIKGLKRSYDAILKIIQGSTIRTARWPGAGVKDVQDSRRICHLHDRAHNSEALDCHSKVGIDFLSLREHLGGIMQIFPHHDIDMWGRVLMRYFSPVWIRLLFFCQD